MTRRLTTVARELQSTANRLALVERGQDRDSILAVLHHGKAKGRQAEARLESAAIVARALVRDVQRLRAELGAMLDELDNKSRHVQ